ncbi:hypothetical protein [Limosilactobacillus sp.]|uniref:hypothetical protein n=1 Tax=Limosilactobacillus sp. TaxID=2773925 RepID=UPI003EFC1CC4
MSDRIYVRTWDPETKLYNGGHYEDPDYKLKDNETTEIIPDGLRPPYKWNGHAFEGSSLEEFEKAFPLPDELKEANKAQAAKQDAQDQLNADLMKQIAQLKVSNATATQQVAVLQQQNSVQAQVNAGLMKDSAMLKVQLAKMAKPTTPATSAQPTSASEPTSPSEPASQPTSPSEPTEGVSKNV